jgi:hypothetical protein
MPIAWRSTFRARAGRGCDARLVPPIASACLSVLGAADQLRLGSTDPSKSPVSDRLQCWPQRFALSSKLVGQVLGSVCRWDLLNNSMVDQSSKPFAQNVRRGTLGRANHLFESGAAKQEISNHQQGPLIPKDIESACNRAGRASFVAPVFGALGHEAEYTGNNTCFLQLSYFTIASINEQSTLPHPQLEPPGAGLPTLELAFARRARPPAPRLALISWLLFQLRRASLRGGFHLPPAQRGSLHTSDLQKEWCTIGSSI